MFDYNFLMPIYNLRNALNILISVTFKLIIKQIPKYGNYGNVIYA